ncbi:hypothetical protein J6590_053573 [Homalodisca vitripennis]|nr:hypothetical protein J6590_053573 [Homalodisca vitripennis]
MLRPQHTALPSTTIHPTRTNNHLSLGVMRQQRTALPSTTIHPMRTNNHLSLGVMRQDNATPATHRSSLHHHTSNAHQQSPVLGGHAAGNTIFGQSCFHTLRSIINVKDNATPATHRSSLHHHTSNAHQQSAVLGGHAAGNTIFGQCCFHTLRSIINVKDNASPATHRSSLHHHTSNAHQQSPVLGGHATGNTIFGQ